MSKIISIILLIIFSAKQSYSSDTLFLERVVLDTPYHYYHAIYISDTYKVNFARHLDDFTFYDYDSINFIEQVPALKKPLNKVDRGSLAQDWVQIFLYKGEYFSYIPSDRGYGLYRAQLLDTSLFIDYTMEGLSAYRIDSLIKEKSGAYRLFYSNQYSNQKIIIRPLSEGRAIFEFPEYNFKALMVDARKLNEYRCVVNYCKTDRTGEFEFDQIDFDKLEK